MSTRQHVVLPVAYIATLFAILASAFEGWWVPLVCWVIVLCGLSRSGWMDED